MAQKIGKLTALRVGRPLKPGMYSDGGGLWLQVTPTRDGKPGGKSWIFRYMVTEGGRSRERYMGLGSFRAVSVRRESGFPNGRKGQSLAGRFAL